MAALLYQGEKNVGAGVGGNHTSQHYFINRHREPKFMQHNTKELNYS